MTPSRPLHHTLAALALAGTLATPLVGCVRYQPVAALIPPAESATVRVTLTDAGSRAVAAALGPGLVSMVGRTQPARGDSLVLRVSRTWHVSGFDEARRGDTVVLAPAHIETTSRREISVLRTIALGTAIGAVAILLRSVVLQSGSGGGTTGGGNGGGTPP